MAVGFTALRAEAVTSGAVLGWDNTVISATNVGSPWLQNLFVAGLSGLLIFWCVRDSSGDEPNRVYPALCAFGVLFLGTVWFSVTKDYSFVPYILGGPLDAQANPVVMWAEAGALSPAVHAVCAVLAVIVLVALQKHRADIRRRAVQESMPG